MHGGREPSGEAARGGDVALGDRAATDRATRGRAPAAWFSPRPERARGPERMGQADRERRAREERDRSEPEDLQRVQDRGIDERDARDRVRATPGRAGG